ncbi:MAG: hypothetical protein VKL42_08930 [Snowella sp.]|nr:hypothetical protein [Snowella sp.]
MQEYTTNWKDINLESPCERGLELISGLTFEALLLEIHCNLEEINEETVKELFENDLNSRIKSAREVFKYNLANIVRTAKATQEMD